MNFIKKPFVLVITLFIALAGCSRPASDKEIISALKSCPSVSDDIVAAGKYDLIPFTVTHNDLDLFVNNRCVKPEQFKSVEFKTINQHTLDHQVAITKTFIDNFKYTLTNDQKKQLGNTTATLAW